MGKTYAVGQLDTDLQFGARAWSYLMEKHTTCKALKRAIKYEERVGESVSRGIEDLRLLSMAVLGKTTMPEFAVESMKLAYSGNRSKGYSENMGNIPMLALLYVAYYGCDQMSYTCPLPLRKIQGALDQIVQFVRDNCEKKETTAIATQMFIDLFTEERGSRKALMEGSEFQRHFAPYSTNPYLSRPSKTEIQASLFSGRFGTETGIDDTKRIERMIREEQVLEGIYGASAVTFNICELPMPIVHYRAKTRGMVASDFGVVPRYVSRYPWGPMFTMRAKGVGGGTVLIDNSGSMSFGAGEVAQIVHDIPVATIASYNGRGTRGTLFILAKNGRMAEPEAIEQSSIGCGNIVDYQSLLWLKTQREPRVWISDGGVTGALDRSYVGITSACHDIVKKNRITRVLSDVESVVRFMKGGR